MSVKLLTEHHLEFLGLERGYTGSYESTLVKMPHFWISNVATHVYNCLGRIGFDDIKPYKGDEVPYAAASVNECILSKEAIIYIWVEGENLKGFHDI